MTPTKATCEIDVLPEAERRQLLVEWNQTAARYPRDRCLHELFEDQVERTPEAVAVVFEDEQLTYRELNERANQLARYLQELGVGPDKLVAICVKRSLEMVVGLLGILKAGGAYVPLDPEYPEERLRFMLHDASASVLLTQRQFIRKIARSGVTTVYLDKDKSVLQTKSKANVGSTVGPQNLVYIIYTSGSTGAPKAAGVYQVGFINLIDWFTDEFRISEADRILLISSLSFDLTQKNVYAPLIRGGTLHLLDPGPYDPYLIIDSIRRNQITLLNCTPSAFYPLINLSAGEDFAAIASLRYVILGGEPISLQLLRPWLTSVTCVAIVANTYGPTECADIATFYLLDRTNVESHDFIPLGKPINNCKVVVVDRNLHPCPVGVPGELCIGGIGVGAGYLNNPELTLGKFVRNPFPELGSEQLYKTGDLVKYLPDGAIEYLGRLDHQVKMRGFRIELGEIESVLSGVPGCVRRSSSPARTFPETSSSRPISQSKRAKGRRIRSCAAYFGRSCRTT